MRRGGVGREDTGAKQDKYRSTNTASLEPSGLDSLRDCRRPTGGEGAEVVDVRGLAARLLREDVEVRHDAVPMRESVDRLVRDDVIDVEVSEEFRMGRGGG